MIQIDTTMPPISFCSPASVSDIPPDILSLMIKSEFTLSESSAFLSASLCDPYTSHCIAEHGFATDSSYSFIMTQTDTTRIYVLHGCPLAVLSAVVQDYLHYGLTFR